MHDRNTKNTQQKYKIWMKEIQEKHERNTINYVEKKQNDEDHPLGRSLISLARVCS